MARRVGLAAIALVLGLLLCFGASISAMALALTQYELWNTADDADVEVYGVNWYGQTFTVGATAHTVSQVRIKAYREGTLTAYLVAEIYAVDGTNHPTGEPLASGQVDASTWTAVSPGTFYRIDLDEEYPLEAATQYALVLHLDTGSATSNIHWRYDNAGGYGADGAEEVSSNAGVTWATTAANDFMFEIWGYAVLEVSHGRVFESVEEDGDWLVTCLYQNVYPPYEENAANPKQYFQLELCSGDGATIYASVKCPSWEYRPGGIYLSAAQVTALEYGSAYRVRIRGNPDQFVAPPSAYYTLTAADWYGTDLDYLVDWVRLTVAVLEEHDDADYTDEITGVGTILNDDGAGLYLVGIPGLDALVPEVFRYTVQPITHEEEEFSHTYETSLATNAGPTLTTALTNLGASFSLTATQMGGVILFILYAVGAGIMYAATRSVVAAFPLALPIVLLGAWMGLISLSIVAVVGVLVIGVLVWIAWFRVA